MKASDKAHRRAPIALSRTRRHLSQRSPKGVFVTTSAFSAQAIDFASRIPQRVVLINGKRLTELMVEHGVGMRISRTVEFKRLDEDFFSEEE